MLRDDRIMLILNFLKKLKLPDFSDDLVVDPVDMAITPEYGRRMGVLAAMHQERVLNDKMLQIRQAELEAYMDEEDKRSSDPLDPASLNYYDPWHHMNE